MFIELVGFQVGLPLSEAVASLDPLLDKQMAAMVP